MKRKPGLLNYSNISDFRFSEVYKRPGIKLSKVYEKPGDFICIEVSEETIVWSDGLCLKYRTTSENEVLHIETIFQFNLI